MKDYRSLSVRKSAVAKLKAMSAYEDRSMSRVLELAIDDRIASYPAHIKQRVDKKVTFDLSAGLDNETSRYIREYVYKAESEGQNALSAFLDAVGSIEFDIKVDDVDLDMSGFQALSELASGDDLRLPEASAILSDLSLPGLDADIDNVINQLDRGA